MLALAVLAFQLLLLPAVAEDASCPCLTTDSGQLDSYKIDGQLYYNAHEYPNDYGMCFHTIGSAMHCPDYLMTIMGIPQGLVAA